MIAIFIIFPSTFLADNEPMSECTFKPLVHAVCNDIASMIKEEKNSLIIMINITYIYISILLE